MEPFWKGLESLILSYTSLTSKQSPGVCQICPSSLDRDKTASCHSDNTIIRQCDNAFILVLTILDHILQLCIQATAASVLNYNLDGKMIGRRNLPKGRKISLLIHFYRYLLNIIEGINMKVFAGVFV